MEHIGRYEILEEIGRGGFGRVFRANDPLMKCEVAIKVMFNADDPEMLARFRGEAAAARKLRHESIVTIYDVGEDKGVPYIVMEYLQGMDLQKIRERRQPLSLVEKVRILSQVAAGLQVAHENGIVHRDVKPANIMVLKDGSVKIMDFGIARATRDATSHLTRTGMVVGTLQYIPPEQFEGHPADSLADLWAFGVIAFQLFSGKNPFEAAETMQVIYNITSMPIADLYQLNPELPLDLCQVVRKLLQRDRNARYQSFEDVRIDLNPILESLEAQEADRLVDDARVIAARGDLTGAHQIVRQVLEKYPSNTSAKQIRDHIISQIRANQTSLQVEELLKKGDQDLSTGHYDEALGSYGQACKLNPNSATARMRWERAQKMAERARRIRESINHARSRLAADAAREAEEILGAVLADDPQNAEASALLERAHQERVHQDETARADAILFSRHLTAQQQFAQAVSVLDDCAAQVGDHPDLEQARAAVRRAEASAATLARIDVALAAANRYLGNGDYHNASAVLSPLAAEFPDNADIRELLKFIGEEEARTRRIAEQRARPSGTAPRPSTGTAPALFRPPAGAGATSKPDRAMVILRALEMSREREQNGSVPEAIHVLEVALSRYPDALELEQERLRLFAPKPLPIEWADGAAPTVPIPEPKPAPAPAPTPPPAPRPIPPPAPNRRNLWLAIAGAGAVCAGLGYWLLTKSPTPQTNPQASQTTPTPAPVSAAASEPTPTAVPVKETEKKQPALASLVPSVVHFSYKKGDSMPSPRVLGIKRSPLSAAVRDARSWLSADVSSEKVVLSLKPSVSGLAPGTYHQPVEIVSNQDAVLLDVALVVAAETRIEPTPTPAPVKTNESTAVATPTEVPKPVPTPVPGPPKPYNGPRFGRTNWTGSLAPSARIVLGESGVLEGTGTLTGRDIPPADFTVTFTPTGLTVRTQAPPSRDRVVIVNTTGAIVYNIVINWTVK